MKAAFAKTIARARALSAEETNAEERLWSDLRSRRLNGYKFVRQLPVGSYFADFACRSAWLVVELDGSHHEGSQRDERRTRWLATHGWSVLRFWNGEVLEERQAVLETILAVLDGRLTEACDGGGLMDGLRFRPAHASLRSSPSPVRAAVAARPPSPAGGRGIAPCLATSRSETAEPVEHPHSPLLGSEGRARQAACPGRGSGMRGSA